MIKPVVLAVLDGWGCSSSTHGNAIAAANIPHWNAFFERYPWTMLEASGEFVGLPKGIMGNSEVGHMNLGSGRVVPQGVVVIDNDIASGEFAHNATLQRALRQAQGDTNEAQGDTNEAQGDTNNARGDAQCVTLSLSKGRMLHFMGLLSDGQVHSSIVHLFALIDAAVAANVPFAVHAFLDGRDTPPRSAQTYVEQLEEKLAAVGRSGAIASVTGRFYGMDRDKRWERTGTAYDLLANGTAPFHATTAREAVDAAYARGENDEFVQATIVGETRAVNDGDACIFFNFRPDRARQLTLAFNGDASVPFAKRAYASLLFATMTKYDESYPNPVLFGPRPQYDTFGEVISRAHLTQLRLAETEKYAHVTYFFNGGREDVFEGEDRDLIASDRSVATYDLAPAMRAREITGAAIEAIESGRYDVIVMNYANADMVGHTGKWEATVAAVEILDGCLGRLADATLHA
ncbi:MAG: 2,3-bisphosphoglycerate-independent phosphoglycerate mutase, partial [bacterium]|nr:2,3-bisphosphoglycerate-independent phosphoglycerate mutase [bacterium]